MPRIPTYESQAGIKAENAPEMSMTTISRSIGEQKETINAIENAEDTLIKVRDFRQTNEADALAFDKLNSIKQLAEQDIDFDYTKYEAEIDKAGMDAANTISGRLAKEEFMAGFKRQATATKWGIKNLFREKELDAAKATIDYRGKLIADSYPTMNEAEQIASLYNQRAEYDKAIKIGLYNKDTAQMKFDEWHKKVNTSQVEYDVHNNPTLAMAELNKGKEGKYPDLLPQERNELVDKADERIKKIEKEGRLALATAQNKTESGLVDKYFDNTITETEVKGLHEQGQISDGFAMSMVKAINSPKALTKTSDKSTFNKIVETMLDPDKEQNEIEQLMLSKNAIGELSTEDMQMLSMFNRKATQEVIDKKISVYKPKGFLQNISIWSDEYGESGERERVKAEMIKEYIGKVNTGENIETALNDVIKNRIVKDVTAAATKPIKKSPAIEAKITELKKQGWSNEKISKSLQEKNINPSSYGL